MTTTEPAPTEPTTADDTPARLLTASVDELRVLLALAGAELPPVCDGDLDGEARTVADLAALRSLLARGWVAPADDAEGTAAGATPDVAGALGAGTAPEVVVEVEVLAGGELQREALVLGPAGDRWLRERHLGVWDVLAVDDEPVARIDALASGPADGSVARPVTPTTTARSLDVEAELAAGGREVLVRVARRAGPERFEAHELHWLVGPTGRWVLEAPEEDVDDGPVGGRVAATVEEIAVPVDADELDDTIFDLLATIAATVPAR